MLKPAILYKKEITEKMQEKFYSTDMLYFVGEKGSYSIDIADHTDGGLFQYACLDGDKLIGFIGYRVDWSSRSAFNFGLISFDKGNLVLIRDLDNVLQKLVETMHRIEWRCVGGNPAEKAYDHFCRQHNGSKFILHDVITDYNGNYHNCLVYEIIRKSN